MQTDTDTDTDLVQFITTQLDALPLADQRDVIQYLAAHYHVNTYHGSSNPYPHAPLPPRIQTR